MSKERLEQLMNFLNEGSTDPFIRYAIATEHVKLKQYDLALKFYQDLLLNNPDYIGTYYHTGKLLELLDRRDEAISVYEKGMQIAKKARNMHAFSELQGVYNMALGLDIDDDDDY
ncbi:tetratricopeptide repeat protein [Albibacterium bauzanense]|uniref:Tetratricopeptide repeat protein n=1 Tax=Albibacterium bauzanense TaxID=653929 RepID=A0A4R1M141_9SPHI|nr:tetratricopeptide repeat protein [Albibacterium bauzanense]TCK85027.1 tetratricopeptide repeat protein [Albibacterium bauzanense]